MRKAWLLLAAALPVPGQPPKIAVIGLVHAHYRSNLPRMVGPSGVRLVGIAETLPDLVAEAKRIAPDAPFFADYKKMLDQTKPDIVWALVENNRHLEIARECAPRKINLIFEKPLASTFTDAEEIATLARRYGIRQSRETALKRRHSPGAT
ncbi:MAG: Gfo/Idh/MocA family oxidoreductase [Bryobacteraceae bacterium]|jgi:predicted dehydrogenase